MAEIQSQMPKNPKQVQAEQDAAVKSSLDKIKNKLIVMSGKGGVGKTSTSVNLSIALANKGLDRINEIFASGQYNLVILDEANVAVSLGLFSVEALLGIMDLKPADVELIITGRDAPAPVIEKADLVSQVNAIKHYFQNGVKARIGIEK